MSDILQFSSQHSALIVDFDRAWSNTLSESLQEAGLRTIVCHTAREALAQVMQQAPSVVYVDLLLPDDAGQLDGGGFVLCDQIQRLNPDIPLVVVTDVDLPDAHLLAEKVGVSAYFTKPVDPGFLIRQTAKLFDSSSKALNRRAKQPSERVAFHCWCGQHFRMCPSRRHDSIACPKCGESVAVPA